VADVICMETYRHVYYGYNGMFRIAEVESHVANYFQSLESELR
jgi:hypothetical protein